MKGLHSKKDCFTIFSHAGCG